MLVPTSAGPVYKGPYPYGTLSFHNLVTPDWLYVVFRFHVEREREGSKPPYWFMLRETLLPTASPTGKMHNHLYSKLADLRKFRWGEPLHTNPYNASEAELRLFEEAVKGQLLPYIGPSMTRMAGTELGAVLAFPNREDQRWPVPRE